MNDADHMGGGESQTANTPMPSNAKDHDYSRGPAPQSCGMCAQAPSRH